MYEQFQNSVSSAAKWFVIALFGVIIMAIFLGVNIKDAKWLNSSIAEAEAQLIQVEAAHQQATYENQERLAAAQTDAEIQQIQRDQKLLDAQYQHDIQALEQDLVHRDIAFQTWMTVLTILAGAFALTLFLATTIWVVSMARVYVQSNLPKEVPMAKVVPPVEQRIPNLPEREPYDPWADPNYRRRMKATAKRQEQKEREEQKEAEMLEVRISRISEDPTKMSGDKRNKLPLAGD
jgi:hypothetical protein